MGESHVIFYLKKRMVGGWKELPPTEGTRRACGGRKKGLSGQTQQRVDCCSLSASVGSETWGYTQSWGTREVMEVFGKGRGTVGQREKISLGTLPNPKYQDSSFALMFEKFFVKIKNNKSSSTRR